VKTAIEQHHPRAVVLETISNPLLKIPDVPAIAQWAHAHDAIVIVDNTFATPYLYRPIEHGVDVVVHSATKYLGGHGDVLAGVVATNAVRANELRLQSRYHGAILGPFEAWLTLRGIRHAGAAYARAMRKRAEGRSVAAGSTIDCARDSSWPARSFRSRSGATIVSRRPLWRYRLI
jgi:cystathionine beta-lyase/cystathionine gamma-synthase